MNQKVLTRTEDMKREVERILGHHHLRYPNLFDRQHAHPYLCLAGNGSFISNSGLIKYADAYIRLVLAIMDIL